jgi:hypothetical protein
MFVKNRLVHKGGSGHEILGNKRKRRNELNIFTVGIELLSSVQNKTVADPK